MITNRNRKRNKQFRRKEFRRCKFCDERSYRNIVPLRHPPNSNEQLTNDCQRLGEKLVSNKSESLGVLIQVCNCNRGACYVHSDCQRHYMIESGRITCEQCRAQFRGLNYNYSKRDIKDFITKCDKGRASFLTALSLLLSLIITMSTLCEIYFTKYDDFYDELTSFELGLSYSALKQNVKVLAAYNIRLFVPFMSCWALAKHVSLFHQEFTNHVREHFNVIFE